MAIKQDLNISYSTSFFNELKSIIIIIINWVFYASSKTKTVSPILLDFGKKQKMPSTQKAMITSTMTVHTTCSVLLSQPVPPHFIHCGFQDGRTSHPVCAEFYGGVC